MAGQINQVRPAQLIGPEEPSIPWNRPKPQNNVELVLEADKSKTIVEKNGVNIVKARDLVDSHHSVADDLTVAAANLTIDDENKTYCVVETQFEVDLDHKQTGPPAFRTSRLVLAASIVLGHEEKGRVKTIGDLERQLKNKKNITAFLCGGPGATNPPDRNSKFNDEYLKNNGCIIFLDYRGTGKSVLEVRDENNPKIEDECNKLFLPLLRLPLSSDERTLDEGQTKRMAEFLTLFRHDNIAKDLEAIRLCLFGASKFRANKKWNIFGQSYGGWISLSYLSLHPEGLESSRITAGLAPIASGPDEAYRQLFQVLKRHNDEYYSTYPEDISSVKKIVKYLLSIPRESPISLSYGGRLTARRFLCLGRSLGAPERWVHMHRLIERLSRDITEIGNGRQTKLQSENIWMYEVEDSWKLDNRPLYAVLHEAMYCSGQKSEWSARGVAATLDEFEWAGAETETGSKGPKRSARRILKDLCASSDDKVKIYFSGEMVYPFMFEDYGLLRPLSGVAAVLAGHEWDDPYDKARLARNQVPVYAISYESDMHVNTELARQTAELVGGIEHVVLDCIPKPPSPPKPQGNEKGELNEKKAANEEEELKRKIRNREELGAMKLEGTPERFQHASVRRHANVVLSCMEELAKRPKRE